MNDAFGIPQTVVVLGGTSQIAGAVVEALVGQGARTIVLAGRDREALIGQAAAALAAGARSAPTVVFDADRPDDAARCIAECVTVAGSDVDLVLMAVGVLGDQLTDEADGTRTAAVVGANFTWPAAALAEAATALRRQGHGRIVVLSSVAGVRVRRANFIYGSAKAGLDAFCLGLGESLRGSGVTVQVVRPGFVRTRMTVGLQPAPFAVGPSEVSAAIMAGLAGNRPVIWVPSALRWVFTVLVHLPQSIWRRLPG